MTRDTHIKTHTQQSVCVLVLSLRVVVHRAEIHMEGPVGESLPGPLAMTLLLQFVETEKTHTRTHILKDIEIAERLPASLEISEPSPLRTTNARTLAEQKITDQEPLLLRACTGNHMR